jgi:hypothetical protein
VAQKAPSAESPKIRRCPNRVAPLTTNRSQGRSSIRWNQSRADSSARPHRRLISVTATLTTVGVVNHDYAPAPATHEVLNQAPPLPARDVFSADTPLVEAVNRHGGDGHGERLAALGRDAGTAAWRDRGMEANRDLPRLRTHDRYGNRVDEVEFHPAWHDLMRRPLIGACTQIHGSRRQGRPRGTQQASSHGPRWSQAPVPDIDDHASVPALRRPGRPWCSGSRACRPAPTTGCGRRPEDRTHRGMAMTEKQGGSDVGPTPPPQSPTIPEYLSPATSGSVRRR